MVVPTVYLIIMGTNPVFPIALLAAIFTLDGLDGYLAVRELEGKRMGFSTYLRCVFGSAGEREKLSAIKERIEEKAKYGPRLDVAGDRIVEYSMWFVFTYLKIIPILVLLVIIIRHSVVDAFMGTRGTSSKMKTRQAKFLYKSNFGRGSINVFKFVTFSYLVLVFTSSFPIIIGYVLAALLVLYVVVRGVAEVRESLAYG